MVQNLNDWLAKAEIPGAQDTSGGSVQIEFPAGDPEMTTEANGHDLSGDGVDSPPAAQGQLLFPTGPGTPNTVESTTGPVDSGTDAPQSEDDPQEVADLKDREPGITTTPAVPAAREGASNMDVGDVETGTSLTKAYRVEDGETERAAARARAKAVQTLKKAAEKPMDLGVQTVERTKPTVVVDDPMCKAVGGMLFSNETDIAVDRLLKSGDDGQMAFTPGLQGNALTSKTLCKACKTDVPQLFAHGTCPACGAEMMQKSLDSAPVQTRALHPVGPRDVFLPNGITKQ